MPQRYFVTRHQGAVKWGVRHGLRARKVAMDHFDPLAVRPGDVVIGTLPIQLVAEVNRRGGHYWHLAMDVPPEWRGRELSADDMDACGARLHEFRVLPLGSRSEDMAGPDVWDEGDAAAERPALHLCIASGQQLPNAVPIQVSAWDRVVIFASRRMKDSGDRLAAFVADEAARRGRPEAAEVLRFDLPDEGSLPKLRTAVQAAVAELRRQYPQHQLVLNITGGLKLMTLAFADVLRGQARILYCDAERGVLDAVEPEGQPPALLGPELDFETYLRVQGFRIVDGGVPDAAQRQRMDERRALTATLALQLPGVGQSVHAMVGGSRCRGLAALVRKLAADAVDSARSGAFAAVQHARLLDDTRIGAEGMSLIRHLKQARLLVKGTEVEAGARDLQVCFADEEAARYLAGGFLEEFAWLSARAAGLPEAHVGINAHLDPLVRRAGRRGDALNEVDVGVAWNARLLLIECKAGRQLGSGDKAQPILNKAVAVRNGVGGALARSWIVGDTVLPAKDAADIGARAKVGQVELRLGAGELERLPRTIAEWAGLPGGAAAIDWRAEVLPLAPAPAQGGKGHKQRR
jgi:CRISPR-associated protein Csx16